jgi:Domain of unknown function (DUF5615)
MLDENFGGHVAELLIDAGHTVLLSVEAAGPAATDQIVAMAAIENGCILIVGQPP